MENIRNSIKAIIVEEGKILLSKCHYPNEKPCYQFNGGGQEPGETFVETLKRECLEELGSEVEIGELVWIREYIGKNHEFATSESEVHQVEYYFRCKLKTPINLIYATHIDKRQIGVEWVELNKIKHIPIFPKKIKECMDEKGNIITALYAGDVN